MKLVLSQRELDTRIKNLLMLPAEQKKQITEIAFGGDTGINIVVWGERNSIAVSIHMSRTRFLLGTYSSEELETNPDIDFTLPSDKVVLKYSDLLEIRELQLNEKRWGKLDNEKVRFVRSLSPRGTIFNKQDLQKIYKYCSKVPNYSMSEIKTAFTETTTNIPEPVKRRSLNTTREKQKQEKAQEKEKKGGSVLEEIEDLEIQMKLLNIERAQILLQQKINKLKRQ